MVGAIFSVVILSGMATQQPAVPVMRVEEDWEIVLNTPSTEVTAPQFHTVISPSPNLESLYMQITWNYREVPDSLPGGLQVQAWNGDKLLAKKNTNTNSLSTVAETISWTQVLHTNGVQVYGAVVNGQSTTWGSFGGSSSGLIGLYALANLNGYSPDFSAANSWITYGANRVEVLRIKQVRRYDSNGNLIDTDTTPRVIYQP